MAHPEGAANPFSDFEDDFKQTEKAPPGSIAGRLPPGTYKFVLTTNEPKDDGTLIDYEVFTANSGTKGFKFFCEVLEPESVPNPKTGDPHPTKGEIIEHVFWVTKKNLPYVMRDIATILGRDLESMGEVVKITWAGRTFEGVVREETDNKGVLRSRIAYINPWTPEETKTQKVSAPEAKREVGPSKSTSAKKVAAPANPAGEVDF